MLDTPDLVCFDLPCLVVPAAGTTEEALCRATRRLGLAPESALPLQSLAGSISWPGHEAHLALRELLGSDAWAEAAAAAFDDAFGAVAGRRGIALAPGATGCIAQLRTLGSHICLTTEFSAATREAVLDVLDWPGLVAMLVSENGPGHDVASAVEAALGRCGVSGQDTVVVSGSISGVEAGRRAAAGWVVGVPGPRASARQLRGAGADHVTGLPQLAAGWAAARLLPA